jgi:uncharacterized protein
MPLSPGSHFLGPTLPVHVFGNRDARPSALIQAGIHGDEVAGVHALEELLEEGFTLGAGRLLVIPTMNPPAYRARQRTRPGGLDLNRCFPGDAQAAEPEPRLAARFMALIEEERPDLVGTLHESWKRFHPQVAASFGQTLVYGVEPRPALIDRVIERLNRELDNPYEVWSAHHYPIATSSTEVIVERVGCLGICVETWLGFPEARRISMQRRTVELLLEELGMPLQRHARARA